MQLVTDPGQITSLTSMRIMVASPFLFAYAIHLIFLMLIYFYSNEVKRQRLYDHGRRLVLFGIAAILSINFLQYGIYHAIVAWLMLIWTIIIHSISFKQEIGESTQNFFVVIYYLLLFVWFFGIIFFYMFNALNS